MKHIPVLKDEVIEALSLKSGVKVIDATIGDAGHAEEILKNIGPNGKLLGLDADPEAVLRSKKFLQDFGQRATIVRSNFENIEKTAKENGFLDVHAVLMDLGWSTPQFEERGRGFSFTKNEPLDMRYNPSNGNITASQILNEYSTQELASIFKKYGEEKLSEQIAKEIVEKRKFDLIRNTSELVQIILDVYRKKLKSNKEVPWIGGIHPATKVFQALRIEVNKEFDVLERALPCAINLLQKGGRLAVISFHSGEDRIVKHFFKGQKNRVNIITKKPIVCSKDEAEQNPSSRSAKLRVVEKI